MTEMADRLDWPLRATLAAMQRRIMARSTYFGIQTWQNPLDVWIEQEILWEVRPDLIIEIGCHRGGHLLALAHLCDALGAGRLIGVDVSLAEIDTLVRAHFKRIALVEGDAAKVVNTVKAFIGVGERVLVIEDSAHTFDHTLAVCEAYGPLVTPGSYLIVQDTICWHGLDEGPNPGPWEAAEDFLATHPEFEADRSREDFGITWHPRGYLRRRA